MDEKNEEYKVEADAENRERYERDIEDTGDGLGMNEQEPDAIKDAFLAKILTRLVLSEVLAVIMAVVGVFLLFQMPSDISFGVCACVLAVVFGGLSYYRYGHKRRDNIDVVRARCIDKTRSGYRRQYYEYTFRDTNDKTFLIKTSQREKFRKELDYRLCFAKTKESKGNSYSGANLLDFEIDE